MRFFWTAIFMALASTLHAFETSGTTAFVVDQTTGMVLYEKNVDAPLPPASMSKLMTLNMLFEALKDGRVNLDTEFRVSTKAHQMGGSKMFLADGSSVTVENLIRGIIVQSGNDACIVVAENLAGSEEIFADVMTKRAQQLGMTQSRFANATGWPHPEHRMSARDLVFLADRLISEFPDYYTYFAEESFTWEGIAQDNRNPLLGLGLGADGLKTGHTSEAGYGLVGSAVQGNRRVIFVISGLESRAARAQESQRIINWAFRQFVQKTLIKAGTELAEAKVWLGQNNQVGLVTGSDINALVPVLTIEPNKYEVTYNGPIPAPIAAGDELAKLVVTIDGLGEVRHPLYAAGDVAEGGLIKRMKASATKLSAQYLGVELAGN
ncbi:MAG: D-alanyl-D-alanine carboxypeptidase family protein [Pseudomonadota bacterium]